MVLFWLFDTVGKRRRWISDDLFVDDDPIGSPWPSFCASQKENAVYLGYNIKG
jgi:hypothetical protein